VTLSESEAFCFGPRRTVQRARRNPSAPCPHQPARRSRRRQRARWAKKGHNMTNQRPCPCGGSNESCSHCYGRGFIENGHSSGSGGPRYYTRQGKQKKSRATVYQVQASYAEMLSLIKPSGEESTKCPLCDFRGTTDQFTRHFALLHGAKRQQRAQRNAKYCPLCNCLVREDRLQEHMSGRCPSRGNNNLPLRRGKTISKRVKTISIKDIELFVKCPACGVKVASSQFTTHRALAHGFVGQNRADPKMASRQIAREGRSTGNAAVDSIQNIGSESARQKGKLEVERPEWWDNLDATKNRGYPAREEGRYGSYPSHDGFDDESKP
jgi:uncharacterized C2H2 Zn-finger protein